MMMQVLAGNSQLGHYREADHSAFVDARYSNVVECSEDVILEVDVEMTPVEISDGDLFL